MYIYIYMYMYIYICIKKEEKDRGKKSITKQIKAYQIFQLKLINPWWHLGQGYLCFFVKGSFTKM